MRRNILLAVVPGLMLAATLMSAEPASSAPTTAFKGYTLTGGGR
jgi:hypothetical protein